MFVSSHQLLGIMGFLAFTERLINVFGICLIFSHNQFTEELSVVMIIWQLDLQLPVQLVPITTSIVSSNPTQARCTGYNII